MAIFRPGPTVAAISGTLGGVLFKQTRYGPVIAKRPQSVRKHTQRQLLRRADTAAVLLHWADMTQEQRDGWNTEAAKFPVTNRLGITRYHSGFQLHNRRNIFRNLWWYLPDNYPPNLGQHRTPHPLTIAFTATTGPYNLTITNYWPNRTVVFVYGCRRLSTATPAHWPSWTFVFAQYAFGPTWDIQTWWDPILGPPQQTEVIGLKVILASSMEWPSIAVIASTTML